MIKQLKSFLALEAASGLILMAVSVLALVAANSPLLPYYETILSHSAKFFINDVLMAVFFLLVGLEIRAEMNGGTLSTAKQAALPLVAALGGVIVPALIYMAFNHGTPASKGWAIPSATDIAFSLGVLALVGSRLPETLKIFLMAVAVIDDIAAIIIIALFYTTSLSLVSLLLAFFCAGGLWMTAKRNVQTLWPYLLNSVALWFCVLASGIHPTIAGVILGLMIPPAVGEKLIEKLHSPVAFGIVPLFAFANAGVVLSGLEGALSHPVTLGIVFGLIVGKPLGIFAASYIFVKRGYALLPAGLNWGLFFGMSVLAGIGFTMSLFIGELAFANSKEMVYVKLGVMLGSLLSAIFGAGLLYLRNNK